MSYTIFYWIHTVSYVAWVAAFIGSLYYAWKVGKQHDTPREYRYIRLERKVTSIGAHIGALGILISGGAMASIPSGPKWGWFDFSEHAWLGLKQVVFFVILILVGLSIKQSVALKKKMREQEGQTVTDAIRRQWKKAYTMSLAIYAMVVFNTIIGLINRSLG